MNCTFYSKHCEDTESDNETDDDTESVDSSDFYELLTDSSDLQSSVLDDSSDEISNDIYLAMDPFQCPIEMDCYCFPKCMQTVFLDKH